jgi:beta-N-acetylhexosaminidase
VTPGEVEQHGTMPASLSQPIVTELLRKQLGFAGLVLTDAMTMGGITAHFEAGEAAVRAILAGADVILLSPDTDAAIRAVMDAVKSGRLTEKRIDESVDRILAAKKKVRLEQPVAIAAIGTAVGVPEHDALQAEIARRSLTLVREGAGGLPLKPGARLLSIVVADEATLNGPAGTLGAELKKRAPDVVTLRLDPRSTPEEVGAAVDAAKAADAVLVSLFVRARSGQGPITVPESGRNAVPALLATGKPVVAVAFGSPYLIRDFPDLPTYLCAWGMQEIVQTAAARALFGEVPIEGHLPVTLPGIAKRGEGIVKSVAPR